MTSSMKRGALGSGVLSGWFGFGGIGSLGVGIEMGKAERALPRFGCVGMVSAWVWRVSDVLKPEFQ